jgi:polyhydroxyalkanoate synthesis regulator protein
MQGLMGAYLEKNIQAFADLQARVAEQSAGLVEGKTLTPEAWAQMLNLQAPVMQGLMSGYLDQSKLLFQQMQEQMQKQAGGFFGAMPGFPVPGAGPGTTGGADPKR